MSAAFFTSEDRRHLEAACDILRNLGLADESNAIDDLLVEDQTARAAS